MEKIPFNRKLSDTLTIAPDGRVEQHWRGDIIKNVFEGKRAKAETDSNFKFYDPNYLMKRFGLLGFEFGNWLNQRDRYIYLAGSAFAIKDFCEIFKIPNSHFGLGNRISIGLGARGRGGAAIAHFEPATFAINITKFNTGGSLGHEYAHALDFYAGRYLDKNFKHNFISEIIEDVFVYSHTKEGIRYYNYKELKKDIVEYHIKNYMVNGLGALMFEPKKGEDYYVETHFYRELKNHVEKTSNLGDYWLKTIEIFARSYEVFLYKKCSEKKIEESFLKKKKYDSNLYPSANLFTPKIDFAFTDFTKLVIERAHSLTLF